jgi:hypothetical protein
LSILILAGDLKKWGGKFSRFFFHQKYLQTDIFFWGKAKKHILEQQPVCLFVFHKLANLMLQKVETSKKVMKNDRDRKILTAPL